MRTTILTLFLLAGCSQSPPPPSPLQFVQVGVAKDIVPMPLGLRVVNTSSEPIEVTGVEAKVIESVIVAPGIEGAPTTFDCHIDLAANDDVLATETHPRVIQPGEAATLKCILRWHVGDEPPPMLAIVSAHFVLTGKHPTECEPFAFVVQSREGAFDLILPFPKAAWRLLSERIGEVAKSAKKRSERVADVVQRLLDLGVAHRE